MFAPPPMLLAAADPKVSETPMTAPASSDLPSSSYFGFVSRDDPETEWSHYTLYDSIGAAQLGRYQNSRERNGTLDISFVKHWERQGSVKKLKDKL